MKTVSAILCVLLVWCSINVSAFRSLFAQPTSGVIRRYFHDHAKHCIACYAKKSKRSKQNSRGKGFSSKDNGNSAASTSGDAGNGVSELPAEDIDPDNASAATLAMADGGDGSNGETDADAIFKKYGIGQGDKDSRSNSKAAQAAEDVDESAFGASVLKKFPMELQKKVDNFLIISTFIALTFCVLCGIAISFGAFKVVFPAVTISPELDNLVVNVLTPAFTPAFEVFFFFSITLGLFKYAQISSNQTVYRED